MVKTNPFFSIIIPTYNRAHIIHRPIDSIIAQTFTDWELIIVDDGSIDDTKSIVDLYQDERIRYVRQENKKESAARNNGICLSNGEWICFQDSDDEYLSQHLQILYNSISQFSEYKVFRTGLLIYEGGNFKSKSTLEETNYDQFPYECFQVFSFHKSIFNSISFDERFFIAEDLHFLLQIGLNHKIKIIDDWTGIYYYDPKSSGGVGPNYEVNLLNRRLCFDDILRWNKILILPFLKISRCRVELLMLYGHYKYNKKKMAFSYLELIKVIYRFPKSFITLVVKLVYQKFVNTI